jgi:hypothetical protein
MSQRIHLNPNRGQQQPMNMVYAPNNTYMPDPIGVNTGGARQGARPDNEILAQIQDVSSKIEDAIEIYTQVSCCDWVGSPGQNCAHKVEGGHGKRATDRRIVALQLPRRSRPLSWGPLSIDTSPSRPLDACSSLARLG